MSFQLCGQGTPSAQALGGCYIECHLPQMECDPRRSSKYSICTTSFNTDSNAVSQCTSAQSLSVWLFATPCTAARQAFLSITNTQELAQTHVHPPWCWCHATISSSVVAFLLLPSIFPSMRVFSSESVLHIRWPKYWSFSFSISPSNEYSGLIFRMYWFDHLAVQGILKSLLQHHSSKAAILWHSAFFMAIKVTINIITFFFFFLIQKRKLRYTSP